MPGTHSPVMYFPKTFLRGLLETKPPMATTPLFPQEINLKKQDIKNFKKIFL
jgi:hypothetical protein